MSRTIELHAIEIANLLKNTVGAKDNFTKDHSDRVSKYCDAFGKYLNLNDKDLIILSQAALFHDVLGDVVGAADHFAGILYGADDFVQHEIFLLFMPGSAAE